MSIRVEFYGVARMRSGVESALIDIPFEGSMSLGDVLGSVARRYPQLSGECIREGQLHPLFKANLDGERFIDDPTTAIRDGQSLLVLSADAGG